MSYMMHSLICKGAQCDTPGCPERRAGSESELDHAWRTLPSHDERVTPTRSGVATAPEPGLLASLDPRRDIGAFIALSSVVGLGFIILTAYFGLLR